MTTYLEKTLHSISVQCECRGIVEVDAVRAEIAQSFGKPLNKMDDKELIQVNRMLPYILQEYLGGKKRRHPVRTIKKGTDDFNQGTIILGGEY